MNIENQVASLELCKRLKELGVNKSSFAQWFVDEVGGYAFVVNDNKIINSQRQYPERYAAYTCSELGHLLPLGIVTFKRTEEHFQCSKGMYIEDLGFDDECEANARALMLIHLIENGHVKVEDL